MVFARNLKLMSLFVFATDLKVVTRKRECGPHRNMVHIGAVHYTCMHIYATLHDGTHRLHIFQMDETPPSAEKKHVVAGVVEEAPKNLLSGRNKNILALRRKMQTQGVLNAKRHKSADNEVFFRMSDRELVSTTKSVGDRIGPDYSGSDCGLASQTRPGSVVGDCASNVKPEAVTEGDGENGKTE
jgi:hypothetical protein